MNEIILDMLTTIIISEDLEFPSILVLNQGFENLEEVKNFRLVLEEVNPTVSRKVIYEGKEIIFLTHGHMRKKTSNFIVDELKRCRGSLMTDSLILMLWVFS